MYVVDTFKLQAEMMKRNWTPKDLAEKLNINLSTAYEYCKCDKRVRYDTAIRFKNLFGAESGICKQSRKVKKGRRNEV